MDTSDHEGSGKCHPGIPDGVLVKALTISSSVARPCCIFCRHSETSCKCS